MSESGSTSVICSQCGATVLDGARFCGMCGAALVRPSERDPYTGEVVAGRYRIQRRIASGGMGEVYVAKHETLDQRVAVKLLHRRFASDERVVARFFNEARSYCRVKHPHAVGLLDFGRLNDGTLYIVTEYIDGVSLSQLVSREGRLPAALVVRLAQQLAEVLAAAHEEQIVHRDLKPDNVMVTEGPGGRSTVKVLDFGIAKILDEGEVRLTKTGAVFGTPEFMSPEQAQGKPVERASDLYSFGALLFYMLSGEAMFRSQKRTEVLQRHISDPPPLDRVRELGDVPASLVSLLADLLEKRPEDRPADMLAVLARLEKLGAALPEVAAATPAAAPRSGGDEITLSEDVRATRPLNRQLGVAPEPKPKPKGTGTKPAPEAPDKAPGPTTPKPAPRAQGDEGSRAPGARAGTDSGEAERIGEAGLAEAFGSSEQVDLSSEQSFELGLGSARHAEDEGYTWGDEEEDVSDDPFKRSLDLGPTEPPSSALSGGVNPIPWVIAALVLVGLGIAAYFAIWGSNGASGAGGGEGSGQAAVDAAGPETDAGTGDGEAMGDASTVLALAPDAGAPAVDAPDTASTGTTPAAPLVPPAALQVIAAGREAGRAAVLLHEAEVDQAAAAWASAQALLTEAGHADASPSVASQLARAQDLVTRAREALGHNQCRRADGLVVEMREISPALRRAFLGDLHDCNRRREQAGRPPRTLE